MGICMTFISVAAAMICTLLTEKVVMGLPLTILLGNTSRQWVNMPQNDLPGIIGEEQEWYPLRTKNSLPCHMSEIQTTPPQGHTPLTSTLEPILMVTMPRVAETLQSIIDEITYGNDFKLIKLFHMENGNHSHNDLNTSIDEPENQWNMHLGFYATWTNWAKQLSNGQHCNCARSVGTFDPCHRFKTENSVGWQIAMKAWLWFKFHVTAAPGCYSLYEWCYQMMWPFSGAPDDPEDVTVREQRGADALDSAVRNLMHDIGTEDKEAQQDEPHLVLEMVPNSGFGSGSGLGLNPNHCNGFPPKTRSSIVNTSHYNLVIEFSLYRNIMYTW